MSQSNWYNPLSWFPAQFPANVPIGLTTHPQQKRSFFTFGSKTIVFDLNTEEDYRNAYLLCSPLKAIVNRRAQMFVNGEVEIVNANTGNKQRGTTAKGLRSILKRPNVLQSWNQFWAQFHIYIDIFGYCPVLRIEPAGMEGSGEISSMWCLPPWLFDVEFTGKWTGQTEISGLYKEFYLNWGSVRRPLGVNNVAIVLDNSIATDKDSNIFIPDSRVKSNEYQVSNIVAALKSRNTLITKKGAIGILSNISKDPAGPVRLKEGDKQIIQDDFKRYGMVGQEWQVIVTDASLQWQAMTFPTKDLMLFEEVEANTQALCDGMGYYYYLLSGGKGTTFNNLSEAKKAQYQDFIIPDANARIQQLSEFIIPKGENATLIVSYNHLPILQESANDKANALTAINAAYKMLYELGMVTKNQWLLSANLDTLPPEIGDKYITDMSDSTPLAVKLGVGGVQALQTILSSNMPSDIKENVLIIVFGINASDANKMAVSTETPTTTTDATSQQQTQDQGTGNNNTSPAAKAK